MAQLKDNCFVNDGELITTYSVNKIIYNQIDTVVGKETVNLRDASGRILAENIISQMDVPPHNNSAVDAILVAVAKNPDSFEANFSAAQILGRTGSSSEEILPYYEKATEIEPSNSKALRELAGAYYDLGEKQKSIQVSITHLRKILRPKCLSILIHLLILIIKVIHILI